MSTTDTAQGATLVYDSGPLLISAAELKAIVPQCPGTKLPSYAARISQALADCEATTCARAAAFVAQVAWETAHLTTMTELADGSAYEGRRDLGNTKPGDGRRYKGRGAFQLTGRDNYQRFGMLLGVDLLSEPWRAAEPELAFRIAAAYWREKRCNEFVDVCQFKLITKAINGAHTIGPPSYHEKREAYRHRALDVLSIRARLEELRDGV